MFTKKHILSLIAVLAFSCAPVLAMDFEEEIPSARLEKLAEKVTFINAVKGFCNIKNENSFDQTLGWIEKNLENEGEIENLEKFVNECFDSLTVQIDKKEEVSKIEKKHKIYFKNSSNSNSNNNNNSNNFDNNKNNNIHDNKNNDKDKLDILKWLSAHKYNTGATITFIVGAGVVYKLHKSGKLASLKKSAKAKFAKFSNYVKGKVVARS